MATAGRRRGNASSRRARAARRRLGARGGAANRPDRVPAGHGRPRNTRRRTRFVELGLRCAARGAAAARRRGRSGCLARARASRTPSRADEVELVTLLGRLLGSAVQNIRAYEAERATVEELRRLSALRADFVSLVSHELRSPMAAVIGSAQTLQRALARALAGAARVVPRLIAHETNRLAELIGGRARHVADRGGHASATRSTDVDVGELVRESAAAAQSRPGRGAVDANVRGRCRRPRRPRAPAPGAHEPGRQRRQVLAGGRRGARSSAFAENGRVSVEVATAGPGSRPSSRADLREVRPRERRHGEAGHRASASSSRARSPRRTAARSRSRPRPSAARRSRSTLPRRAASGLRRRG